MGRRPDRGHRRKLEDPDRPRDPNPLADPRRQVSAASLGVLRVALGAVAVLSSARILGYGWADSLYSRPSHRFSYLGLGWIPQPGPTGVRLLLGAVAVAGLGLILGRGTRWWALLLLVSFGWVEAIDTTTYLNHYWFVTLMAALAVVAPMDRARPDGSRTVAVGWVWLFRFQVAVVYVFAGLAKLHPDWLVEALPLRLWLPARAHLPLVGPLLATPATAHVLSAAGALYDCLVVPGLLWRRTRPFAWAALVAFHISTWLLFPIGVFPWLMIAASTIFWEPDWPVRLATRIRHLTRNGSVWFARHDDRSSIWFPTHRATSTPPVAPPDAVPTSPVAHSPPSIPPVPTSSTTPPALGRACTTRTQRAGTRSLPWAAGLWVVVQIALPLRHLAYPGDHRWTGEGYRFGWNVLLVERTGSITFVVTEPASGRTWTADVESLYTPNQIRVMSGEPDLILQAAHAIRATEAEQGRSVEVRVDAWMSLNGRPAQRWIDPAVDLAAEPSSLSHKDWILPPE